MIYEKTAKNYRLSAEAISAVDRMAAWKSLSRTAVVEIAIREAFDREAKRQRQFESSIASDSS